MFTQKPNKLEFLWTVCSTTCINRDYVLTYTNVPILKTGFWRLVLFRQYEVNKVFISHLAFNSTSELSWSLRFWHNQGCHHTSGGDKISRKKKAGHPEIRTASGTYTWANILSTILYVSAWFPYLIRFSLSIKKSWSVSSSQNLQYIT